MGKLIKLSISLLEFWIFFSSLLTFLFLFTWLMSAINEKIYGTLNSIFGFLPRIMDLFFYNEADIFGVDVTMGYVYSAMLIISTAIFAIKIKKRLLKISIKEPIKNRYSEKKLKEKKELIEKQKNDIINEKIKSINNYFGLFEFDMKFYEKMNNSNIDFEKLKKEYSKLIIQKIQSKYKNITFINTEKIFFISKDFSSVNYLIDDLVKLFEMFKGINETKFIKTDMIFSLWCDEEKFNPKEALKILVKINFQRYINKVVVPFKFTKRYEEENQIYKFSPLGISWLDMVDENNSNMEVELFSVKKI